jgi:hypothetical protein
VSERQTRRTIVLMAALAMGSVGSLAADDFQHRATASQEKTRMWMTIGGTHRFAVTLENNPAARAFAQMLPLTLDMPDLRQRHLGGVLQDLCVELQLHANRERRRG